jgi:hypothetical protein
MLEAVECTEQIFHRVKNVTKKQKDLQHLIKNLRMSICEMG